MNAKQETKNKKAFNKAHEVRQFEIDLYWKRATYFWGFITVSFAGFTHLIQKDKPEAILLAFLIANLGTFLTYAWILANLGGKWWQEYWEQKVRKYEGKITGSLMFDYLDNNPSISFVKSLVFLGTARFSVSKINLCVCRYIFCIWFLLLVYSGLILNNCSNKSKINDLLQSPYVSYLTFIISAITFVFIFLTFYWSKKHRDPKKP